MKTTLLMLMAVVVVGCAKKNPPEPEAIDDTVTPSRSRAESERKSAEHKRKLHDYKLEMDKWYNSLVVCLHCGSDLKAKGARVCSECLRPQRD